jgi:AcrR family transcriptional regulator
MRRDARERREALIAAAAESFAEHGYGIALEEVAVRAGVGRGTLYRNFKDREALALAIFGSEIDRVGAIVAEGHDLRRTMIELARTGARGSMLIARIGAELVAGTENLAALEALAERLAVALEPLASRAHAAGDLRADIDGRRLALALRMVGGLLHRLHADERAERQLLEAVDLVIEGVRPR